MYLFFLILNFRTSILEILVSVKLSLYILFVIHIGNLRNELVIALNSTNTINLINKKYIYLIN